MIRLPSHLDVGPYTIHLAVLAARWQRNRTHRRRTWRVSLGVLAVVVAAIAAFPHLWGTGTVVVPEYAAATQLTLDGHTLHDGTMAMRAGTYTLQIEQAGAFPVTQTVRVTKGYTTTLTLPELRPIPLVQRLPLPEPGSTWAEVSPDVSGGWRLTAMQSVVERAATTRPGWGKTNDVPAPRDLLHLDQEGLTRLSVLEAYPVADETTAARGARFWAEWAARSSTQLSNVAGVLTLTTPSVTSVVSTTVDVRGVWWSPGGQALLVALPHDGGVDLALLDPKHPHIPSTPLITMPGVVQSVNWHSDGDAVVVISAPEVVALDKPPTGTRVTPTPLKATTTETALADRNAVLLRLPHTSQTAQATRLRAPPAQPAGLVPLAWSTHDLWWVTDTGLGLALDRVALADGNVARIGRLPDNLVALTVLADETVRIVRAIGDGTLVAEHWPEGTALFTLPEITTHDQVGGMWRGDELLLATGNNELWFVQIQPEALQ